MTWVLLAAGLLLIGFGLAVGYTREMKGQKVQAGELPRAVGDGNAKAWDVIARPLPRRDEAIALPGRRAWYNVGRFGQGVMVGFGVGLLVTALAVVLVKPNAATPPAQSTQKEDPKTPAAPSPGGQTQPPAGQIDTQTPPAPAPNPTPAPPPAPATITVVIPDGMATAQIAAELKAAGVIADEAAFLEQVTAQGAEGKLRSGTFMFPSGATRSEVINILVQ